MNCVNCGAPLSPKSNVCTFCGTLNDTDLRAIGRRTTGKTQSNRTCPRCDVRMDTIELGAADGLCVERCDKCLGMFFDPNELESLIDTSVSRVFEVDFERMSTIVEEEAQGFSQVTYVKCPVCANLMNRKTYGPRSGVIVDTCRGHGAWLDGGELGQILKWAAAGGRLHADNKDREQERREERAKRARRIEAEHKAWGSTGRYRQVGRLRDGDDLLVGVMRALGRWLR